MWIRIHHIKEHVRSEYRRTSRSERAVQNLPILPSGNGRGRRRRRQSLRRLLIEVAIAAGIQGQHMGSAI